MAKSREELLDAAVDYVAEHGLPDLSLRACAQAIGTSHRMLSYHFGSREGLITAIADEAARRCRMVIDRYAQARDVADAASTPYPVADVVDHEVRRDDLMGLLPILVEVTYLIIRGQASASAQTPRYTDLVELWRPVLTAQLRLQGLPLEKAETRVRLALAVIVGSAVDYVGTGDRATYAAMTKDWLELATEPMAGR